MAPSVSMPSSAARQVALPGSSDTSEHQQSRHAAAEEEDGGDHIEYRQAREIPFELREHCTICFEEGLYSQAISLLQSLLLAETLSTTVSSAPPSAKEPAIRPPSAHLALVATLVVHPSVTTRASSAEQLGASDAALRLLHATNDVLGPLNSRFSLAFAFTASGHASRESARRRRLNHHGEGSLGSTPHSPAGSDDLEFDQQQGGGGGSSIRRGSMLDTSLATTSSLFTRADDFWHLVGWALNCSVRHPKRWQRWKLFLGFLFDVIEDDLAVRTAAASEANNRYMENGAEVVEQVGEGRNRQNSVPQLSDALLLRYCSNAEGRAGRRRIMRAILADGTERSMREFREIFVNETAEKKKDDDERKESEKGKQGRRELNFDEGLYGDYDSSDDELGMETGPARSARSTTSQATEPTRTFAETHGDANSDEQPDDGRAKTAADEFGGMESVLLRQRLLLLLSYLSAAVPTLFTTLPDLFALYTEFLRPLPLRHFTLFLQSSLLLPPSFRNCLFQMLLRPLISAAIPRDEIPVPTAAELEKYFLPLVAASASVADNAKVSVILEGLVGGLVKRGNESGESCDESGGNVDRCGGRRGATNGRNIDGSSRQGNRSRSTSRRGSEILRRNEDGNNNNNNNNNNYSCISGVGGSSVNRRDGRYRGSLSSSTTTTKTTKESFMSAVQEGIRKRAEKTRRSACSGPGGGGGSSTSSHDHSNDKGKNKKKSTPSTTTTTATSTKKMEIEEDRETLEMSAERLLMMAEAVVI